MTATEGSCVRLLKAQGWNPVRANVYAASKSMTRATADCTSRLWRSPAQSQIHTAIRGG